MTEGEKEMPALVEEMRGYVMRWRCRFRIWIAVHYGMGSLAVLIPLAIGSAALDTTRIAPDGLLALIGVCAAGLVTFLRPDKYAAGFFFAYNTLEIALKRFLWDADGARGPAELIDAFELARGHITRMQPDQTARQRG